MWTMIVLAGFGTAIPADAKVSANLQRNATQWRGGRILRRNYYEVCVARGGIIDPLDPNKQFRSGEDWSR